jgi:L-arabinose transport system substrate-binding protein
MFRFARKATVLLVASAVGLFGISACNKADNAGGGAGGGSDLKIGFIVKQPEEPWFQLEWKFAQQAADKLGFELIKIGAPDGEKVLTAIDTLAASGAKGFVICTPDVKLGPAIVNKAKVNNLKLIAVDDRFLGADGKPMEKVHYLGISARKIGENVGQELWKEMQKRGWPMEETAAGMVTFDELETARERTAGAKDALVKAGFPENKIYAAPQKTTDVPGAFDAVNILLTQHPEVKHWLFFGMNDSAVMGAVRAAEGRQISADNMIGIGINGTDAITEFEKPNPTGFFGSMLLSAREHGYKTTEMMYNWITKDEEPPLDTRTVGVFITRDNYEKLLKEQGIRE